MLNEEHADTKYPFITYVEFCLCTDNVNNVCDNRDERQKEKRQNHGWPQLTWALFYMWCISTIILHIVDQSMH